MVRSVLIKCGTRIPGDGAIWGSGTDHRPASATHTYKTIRRGQRDGSLL